MDQISWNYMITTKLERAINTVDINGGSSLCPTTLLMELSQLPNSLWEKKKKLAQGKR